MPLRWSFRMRWPIVRLIALREIRDLLRDRRTLLMLLGLPALLYPLLAAGGLLFALATLDQPTVIGIVGLDHLPPPVPEGSKEYPALVVDGRFPLDYCTNEREQKALKVLPLGADDGPAALDSQRVDVLVTVPADFTEQLNRGERPTLSVRTREADETSKLASRRLRGVLGKWKADLKKVRFERLRVTLAPWKEELKEVHFLWEGPAERMDQPIRVDDPHEAKPVLERMGGELRDTLARFFPFLLVMWALAGALHPAIDVTAGEKERGTMETLLISPTERREIVLGKFLAVWAMSSGTALWNLMWMGGLAVAGDLALPEPVLRLSGLFWCVVLTLPLSALFSAVCLALGVYARSSKEGQYYLIPLFMVVLPLASLSLAPGMKLDLISSLLPVTGAALLLQRMMSVSPEPTPWWYFVPVLLSLTVCVRLALRWAVTQFHREDVLFREAERLDLGLWLRRMLRGRPRPKPAAVPPPEGEPTLAGS